MCGRPVSTIKLKYITYMYRIHTYFTYVNDVLDNAQNRTNILFKKKTHLSLIDTLKSTVLLQRVRLT